jgi:hypothetical protein
MQSRSRATEPGLSYLGSERSRFQIAEGALPEAEVAGGYVEVAGQTPEVGLRGRVRFGAAEFRFEAPPVEDGDPAPRVTNREGEVDGVVADLRRAASAGRDEHPSVDEMDLLRLVAQV